MSTTIYSTSSILSDEEVVSLLAHATANRSLNNFDVITQSILIVSFGTLILFGAAGNGLVCYVVLSTAGMRTPRNLLILNLALSDLTLCLFVQPFNLLKV